MEIPHEDQSSHYDHEKDKFAYLSMRYRIELGKRQVQQSQWGSKYALNGDDSYEHTVGECPTIPTMRDMYGYQSSYTSSWNNHPNLTTEPQPQPSMSTSSLEQAILKISKFMEDFVDRHFGGDYYDNSMDQPSIENHKVQDDKGLPEPFKASTSLGKRRERNSLGPNGKDANFVWDPGGIQHEESNASNGVQIGVETKKLWSLQENCAELNEKFALCDPRCEKFRTVRNHLLAHECHFAHLKPIFTPCETRCKIHSKVRKSQFKVHQFCTPQFKKLWPFEDDYAKLNGNVAAAPNFTTVRHVFGALNGAQIMYTIYHFEAWEVRNPILQTVHDLDLKRRSYGCLKIDCAKPPLSIPAMAKTRGEPCAPWDHTHEASHSISDLPKPSKLIAPVESSSRGDYAT
ncbi:hypothetical protein CK203_106135 [Vitis vinifera]|uniref:Uncharacterized protein n=1 Tax=Vitis vinifera TaxID=29760 RepID=A0A438C4N4_VITVI|nr:hypothetical protein CK203_106135 [Vitis vinifera]